MSELLRVQPELAPPAQRSRVFARVRGVWGRAVLAVAAFTLLTLLLAVTASSGRSGPNAAGWLVLSGLVLAGIAYGGLVVLELWLLQLLPRAYQWTLAAAAFVMGSILAVEGVARAIWGLPIVFAGVSLLGAGLAGIVRPRPWHGRRKERVLLGGAALILLPLGAWLLWPGRAARVVAVPPAMAAARLTLPNPSQLGPYDVRQWSYGGGEDRRRPEYGSGATWRAPSVDGSSLLPGWSGVRGAARTRYWGFDSRRLPLQGRVFLPEAAGRFPLVVFVHGQRNAETVSDRGFDYFLRLLSSRGAAAVSIDENFLNYSLADMLGGSEVDLSEDIDARAFLLLEHLRLWRHWNEERDHPLFGRVDLTRVLLVGHSRGGEAAALAAVLNRLSAHPGLGRLGFDYGFSIRGIAALAPPDASVFPGGRPLRLEDVDYLVLHGSKDGEVPSYAGSRQYQRVRFTTEGPWFKAGVYVRGADHSQFNSDWRGGDFAFPARLLQSRRSVLARADQEQVAATFVSAFVEAVLHGRDEYRALFRDVRAAPSWLPATDYVQQYWDAGTRVVADFEEDLDLATATLDGARVSARGLAEWSEGPLTLRALPSETRVVRLGWPRSAGDAAAARPFYAIALPDWARTAAASRLTFHLADLRRDAAAPLDVRVEASDRSGHAAGVRLSAVGGLLPPIPTDVFKAGFLDPRGESEPVLQRFEIALEDFRAVNPAFDPGALASVRFVFDASRSGRVALDDVGLR